LKVSCNSKNLDSAQRIIKQGGIVIFPTDTVYGIGCNPYDKEAIKKLYKIKKRSVTKFFPVLVYSMREASKIAIFDKKSSIIAKKLWPGQITLILKIKDKKIKHALDLEDKIAVRVPNNKCTLKLLKTCKVLVGTSANISGHDALVDPKQYEDEIKKVDLFIDDGKIVNGGESTIAEIINNNLKIYRKGKISKQEILEIL